MFPAPFNSINSLLIITFNFTPIHVYPRLNSVPSCSQPLSSFRLAGKRETLGTTIVDKSLGTNLHLWRFFTCAKQTVTHKFIYTCSAPPPLPLQCWRCVHAISPEFQHCIGGVGGRESSPKEFCPPLQVSFQLVFSSADTVNQSFLNII